MSEGQVVSNRVAVVELAEGTPEDGDARLAHQIRELREDLADNRGALHDVSEALEELKRREARLERSMTTVLRALIKRNR